jgi:SulP family sulfate permease
MQIVVATALAAIAVNIEFCILIGVFLSVALYVGRAARVHLTELTMTPERVIRERVASDPRCDRILIYGIEGELFFGSAPDLEKHFATIEKRAGPRTRAIVLRVKRVRNSDAVCLDVFDRFIARMRARGIQVILCGVRHDFAKVIRKSGLQDSLGKENIFREQEATFSATLAAIRFAYGLLRDDFCSTCPRRADDEGTLYYMI